MITVELNIGLFASPRFPHPRVQMLHRDSSNGRTAHAVARSVIGVLEEEGFTTSYPVVHTVQGEPTLYVRACMDKDCYPAYVTERLERVARKCAQDCIAVRFPDGKGLLLGDHVARWGSYDDSKFMRLVGV